MTSRSSTNPEGRAPVRVCDGPRAAILGGPFTGSGGDAVATRSPHQAANLCQMSNKPLIILARSKRFELGAW
jgi:hypothetical protein